MGAIRYVGKIDNHALAQKTLAYILNLVHKAQVLPYCVVDMIFERAPKMMGLLNAALWPLRCCIMTPLWHLQRFVTNMRFRVFMPTETDLTLAVPRAALIAGIIVMKLLGIRASGYR